MIWLCCAGGYLAALVFFVRVVQVCEREESAMRRCRFPVLHLVPRGDVIEHTCGGEECVCGPEVRPVRREGGWQWVATHHALMPDANERA